MSEAAETPVDQDAAQRRRAAADKLDRHARWAVPGAVAAALLGVFAVVDMFNHWLGIGWRLDIAFIVIGVVGAEAPLSLRRTARRLRSIPDSPQHATRRQITKAIGVTLGAYLFLGAFGYLLAGWILAVLMPTSTFIIGLGTIISVRRRVRRRQLTTGVNR